MLPYILKIGGFKNSIVYTFYGIYQKYTVFVKLYICGLTYRLYLRYKHKFPDWESKTGILGSTGVWDPRVGNESQTRFPENEFWDSDLSGTSGTAAGVLEG